MRRRARLTVDTPEVNLVPLLDMVSLLIQMLLVSAQFGAFAEVESQVAGPGAPMDTENLGFDIRVATDGYVASWTEGGERKERALGCGANPCTEWNGAGLAALAQELKRSHPAERQVVVTPDPGVPFEGIVTAMDAVRSAGETPLFPDLVVSP
ncbi:MAG: biopolymer transporter ExbD [Deltaproteobacteria bacterium]|nr:biopolymer transporter ExbD [Deltaproteobacteria bacterium]